MQTPDFEKIYAEYFSEVYRYILSLSQNETVAEESTQETFFKALRHIDKFNGNCKLYVWLCQIAKKKSDFSQRLISNKNLNCNIITVEHINKKYGNTTVLRDVSIHIKQGEIYGLIGKNGAGKTTLLRILCGLIPNYSGKVTFSNIDGDKCKVAAVINSPALFLNMTAFENLKEQSTLLGLHTDTKIYDILQKVGLEDYAYTVVKDLSLGMTQRLKLGMALLENPDLLILDEPVNGLDPDGIADLRKLLHHLNKEYGITILISSHILSELEHTATCFGILNDGVITKEISIQDIQQSNTTLENLYMQYTKGGHYYNA